MASNAELYSKANKPQYDAGCDFVRYLAVAHGNKVLDIGCGTGDVSNFVASQVGPDGSVVALDPDEARIKIAQERYKDIGNLSFLAGDCSSKIPHDDEPFYDLHFSSSVIHWLLGDAKQVYMKQAHRCLKPGGRIAFLTGVKNVVTDKSNVELKHEYLSEAGYKNLCESNGFVRVHTQVMPYTAHYVDHKAFEDWFQGTIGQAWSEMTPEWQDIFMDKHATFNDDGSIALKSDYMLYVVAYKE